MTTYVWIIFITLWITPYFYHHVWWHMSGLSLSHYELHLNSTITFDVTCLDYLYHTMAYTWHLLPRMYYIYHTMTYIWLLPSRLTTYVWIIFIILWVTSGIYYHGWRLMSGLSLSRYSLHLTSTTTFDDICLDYLYHTMAYTWHLLPRLTTYVGIIFITLWLTLDIYYHVWRHMSGLSL